MSTAMGKQAIGFIGQGYIGKNYADDFESRGYPVVRYSLEPEYVGNRDRVAECEMVFIGVPTPTTPAGFDDSIVRSAVGSTAPGTIVVIKSTIVPGSARAIRDAYPDRLVMYSPEFLSEATAAYDAAHPIMNVVGITRDTAEDRAAAARVLSILPDAPYTAICASDEAELIKYAHNGSAYTQIIFFNMMYDLAGAIGASWHTVAAALAADPLIPNRYSQPVHKTGRGAGGHCFIKDIAALRAVYEREVESPAGVAALRGLEAKNIELLTQSKKDLDILAGVYGTYATTHHDTNAR
ncbi:MAG TPA: hypothetical protein VHB93_00455 [Candidatus Paceibacterota bacterium]|nr:hypothetical protein [Candidatus Paceibacterota bacterium]